MLALLVVLLVAAALCGRLGMWQLDRARAQGEARAQQQLREVEGEPPVSLATLLQPQSPFPGELVGRQVVVDGFFDGEELLVPGRVLEGRTGYLVLTPLRVATDGDPVLAVVRGWVPDRASADALDPAPTGTVQVTGYLQSGEAGVASDPRPGEVEAVSPGELVNRWGGPIYSAYLVLNAVTPPQDADVSVLPAPALMGQPGAGTGPLNLQNLAYALQWWIFAAFALVVWARVVRDETRAAAEEALEALEADDDAAGGDGDALSRARSAADADATP